MSRVLIANMPFFNLCWPNIGPSLLKAALHRRGIDCDIAYFNFDLAERIGADRYQWIADYFAFVLGGERLFAKDYFGQRLPDDDAFMSDVLLHCDPDLTDDDRRDYQAVAAHVGPFLDRCVESVDWSRYAVVGFAASFQQTMASMCLARRIKRIEPRIKIVFGGAACEGQMGIELLAQFPEADYVFLGEADLTFPGVMEQLLEGRAPELPPGVVGRHEVPLHLPPTGTQLPPVADPSRFMVRDMDALPYPDFDDYFARAGASPLIGHAGVNEDDLRSLLFFETSRGCWWGQKHHCAFCGLNGSTLAYRSKSPRRALDELRYLVQRHGVHQACSSDNILDHRYFTTFLPMLKEAPFDLAFVFEMKTNMTRRQVEILIEAGLGAAQLGIETFITPVLKLIGKGANACQNLQTLKWFSEAGVEVKWNILYGFPGENPKGYDGLADLVPSLVHLAPPLAVGRVRMDRFSPYFDDPPRWGMANARPNRAFRFVYPFADDVLHRLAYYYEYDYADGRNPLDYASAALARIACWQEIEGSVTLRQFDRSDGVLILTDTRPCAVRFQSRLSGLERDIYMLCDKGHTLRGILRFVGQSEHGPADEARVVEMLDDWVSRRLMVHIDDRYLSLALRSPPDEQ